MKLNSERNLGRYSQCEYSLFLAGVATLALYKRFSEERMKVNQGVDVLTQLPLIIKSMLILIMVLVYSLLLLSMDVLTPKQLIITHKLLMIMVGVSFWADR